MLSEAAKTKLSSRLLTHYLLSITGLELLQALLGILGGVLFSNVEVGSTWQPCVNTRQGTKTTRVK